MAKKPSTDIDQGDWLWLLTRVTLDRDVDGLRHITVELPNGQKATLVYNPDEMKKADV